MFSGPVMNYTLELGKKGKQDLLEQNKQLNTCWMDDHLVLQQPRLVVDFVR